MPVDYFRLTKKLSKSPTPLWRAQAPFAAYKNASLLLQGKTLDPTLAMALTAQGAEDYYFGSLKTLPNNTSRWSDASFPVWYGAENTMTAIHESLYHAVRIFVNRFGVALLNDWGEQRTLVYAECNALLVDVTGLSARHGWLIDDDHSRCQGFGKFIHESHQPGILYDSARHQGGICSAIYNRDALSDPSTGAEIFFSCCNGTLEVKDAEGLKILSRP